MFELRKSNFIEEVGNGLVIKTQCQKFVLEGLELSLLKGWTLYVTKGKQNLKLASGKTKKETLEKFCRVFFDSEKDQLNSDFWEVFK